MFLWLPFGMAGQINLGLGMQLGYYRMENADKPIDRFNQSGFLTKRMGLFRLPGGEIYLASLRHDSWLLELNLNTKRARASAESFSGNVLNRRDLRFSMQGISLGGGYAFVETPTLVCFGGISLELGYMRLSTRTGAKENIGQIQYATVDRTGLTAVTIFSKLVFRSDPEAITSWSLSPYLHLPLQRYDFHRVAMVLFPPTEWNADGNSLPARPWNFGLALNFDIDIVRLLL
jgi:hypothetical protein